MENGIVQKVMMKLHYLLCSTQSHCIEMYRCKNTKYVCIALTNMCDNQNDCPYSDDEIMCELQNQFCPQRCYCLMYALSCSRYNEFENMLKSNYISMYISESNIKSMNELRLPYRTLQILQLPENNIKFPCNVKSFTNLVMLNLMRNQISNINKHCFSSFIILRTLKLQKNLILYFKPESFYNMKVLNFLDISSNPVIKMMSHCFTNLPELKILYLTNVTTKTSFN